MSDIYTVADETSIALGKEKGAAPAYEEYALYGPKRRNGTLTTVAPTGTLSLIANCSSGCEPNFAFNYTKYFLTSKFSSNNHVELSIVAMPIHKAFIMKHFRIGIQLPLNFGYDFFEFYSLIHIARFRLIEA